ncbi:MAG TPA: family 2A encapsulin nanocompartment shell protein [Thermodesulfobacteriota bacterium]|nr:family 2A encapsulin nanocompartment shell protein [Thermodesulfobacteriota bacterium]
MAEEIKQVRTLGEKAAFQLTNVTKTAPQFGSLTPRWLVRLLEWKAVEAGTFRRNRVKEGETPLDLLCSQEDGKSLPETFVDYEEAPREYTLSTISTIINIHTRVSDIYSSPYDQIKEQLRLAIESVKERQESELINNGDYGLLNNVPELQRIQARNGSPTPDDLDELISKVRKEPSFFLAHPRAIAAFGREATRRGVPPPTVSLFGSQFLTWRGLPLVPTETLFVDGLRKPTSQAGKTNILLLRVGEKKQGVVGLFQSGLPGEQTPGLSVRFMGIDKNAVASYLISLYCSASVLTDDAIGVLEDVEVGNYYDYEYNYV